MPEIALAKVNPEAPLERACLFACGLSTGLGAAINTAKVAAGHRPASSSAPAWSGSAPSPAAACRAPSGSSASTSPRSGSSWPAGQGATETMIGGDDTVERILEETDGFGADYTFEATGNVAVMRQAVEAARMGWGLCTVAGVAGKGETLDVDPALPDHRPPHRRLLVRRRQGPRRGARSWSTATLAGEIDVDPFISHRITLDEVNRGFELMEAQDGIRSVIEFGS